MFNEIYVTGTLAWDVIMNFPGTFKDHFHPDKLHQINISFAVNSLEKRMGGTATNISYALGSVLKFYKRKVPVSVLGSIGRDGHEHLKLFTSLGVNSSSVFLDKESYCATGSVITDALDNQIWGFYYGASEYGYRCSIPIRKSTNPLLIISANHPRAFTHFQNESIKKHVPYLYDFGMSLTFISDSNLRKGIANSWGVVGNDYEIAMLCKRLKISVADMVGMGKIVITTLGSKGVLYQTRSNKICLPAFKTKVIDPTGAGDAWRGAFCAGLLMNFEIKKALALANSVASIAVEHKGCVGYILQSRKIHKRMEELLK